MYNTPYPLKKYLSSVHVILVPKLPEQQPISIGDRPGIVYHASELELYIVPSSPYNYMEATRKQLYHERLTYSGYVKKNLTYIKTYDRIYFIYLSSSAE